MEKLRIARIRKTEGEDEEEDKEGEEKQEKVGDKSWPITVTDESLMEETAQEFMALVAALQ